MHAGTLLVGKGQKASCVFRLPCEHPVHWEKNGDRHSAMLISILSNILSHPYIHTHTRTHAQRLTHTHKRKLPCLVANSMSISLLMLPSNWHIDWWWRAKRTAKWLLAELQRERQESLSLLSKTWASFHSLPQICEFKLREPPSTLPGFFGNIFQSHYSYKII